MICSIWQCEIPISPGSMRLALKSKTSGGMFWPDSVACAQRRVFSGWHYSHLREQCIRAETPTHNPSLAENKIYNGDAGLLVQYMSMWS